MELCESSTQYSKTTFRFLWCRNITTETEKQKKTVAGYVTVGLQQIY